MKKLLTVIIIIVLSANLALNLFKENHYIGLIPAKLEIQKTLLIQDKSGIFSGCGVIIFRISGKIINDIKEQGIGFFKDASIARSPSPNTHSNYGEWSSTPLPESSFSEGFPLMGAGCSGGLNNIWINKITEATKSSGSYYSYSNGGMLLVIPDLKIMILDYWD